MGMNLKKFVNPKFTRTIDLGLLRRLLERHAGDIHGFDMAVFDGPPEGAREAVQRFFMGPEEGYGEGLVSDLHRIAELGHAHGLQIILEQARRLGFEIVPERDEGRQDPKHVALAVFLDHPRVFDAASDMLALAAQVSLAEFAGLEEGVEAEIDAVARAAFERAAAILFEADFQGRYCRVGWYEDGSETNLVVAHGAAITTTPVVDQGAERVISYRPAEHAVLSYSADGGRLKIGGVPKARRADMAELFAKTILRRPGFFAGTDAQNLYTLEPIERAGFAFSFQHDFDPGILRVRIVEAQVDRVGIDPRSGKVRIFHSYLARDGRDNALARLGEVMRHVRFGADWRLGHIVTRVEIDTGAARPARVTVKLKPPSVAAFRRHRFEARIMTLLGRNGLCHERDARGAAAAAQ
ncbi:MAG: hypothetical protein Kow00104_01280 [Rhodothalassiaceae bacterium]